MNEDTKIIHLGFFNISNNFTQNCYLIQANESFLIDIPPITWFDAYKLAIEKHLPLSQCTYIVIQHISMSHITMLLNLIAAGFKGSILTNNNFSKQLILAKLPLEVILIENINYTLKTQDDLLLHFLPVRFLPFPQMFMTYLPSKCALFSSMLFSSFYSQGELPEMENIKMSVFAFHKYMMPNCSFLRLSLQSLKDLSIESIYPLKGYQILPDNINEIIEFVSTIEFNNDGHTCLTEDYNLKEIKYENLILQVIEELSHHVSRQELEEVFNSSSFQFDFEKMTLVEPVQGSLSLWNQFFSHIYLKKGASWLFLLESLVNQFHTDYAISKPEVYSSELFQISAKYEFLKQEKSILENRLDEVNTLWEQTTLDTQLCPITKLFNQDFLKLVLLSDLEQEDPSPFALILVQVDRLVELNRRYGTDTGDETISNMGYLLQQIIKEETQLFKQNGPGIIIYEKTASFKNIQKSASRARNAIQDSSLFIEQLTASISVVTYDEIDHSDSLDNQIDDMFILLEQRIALAKGLGKGTIIDKNSADITIPEGIILLVDEDEINQNMLYRFFNRINYRVKLAKGVEEALEILETESIDIIISEINLSKIDGFTLKRLLNKREDHQKIPFIMVSHNKTLENIKRGNLLNVDLILEKPIVPDELIGHVKRFKERIR